MACLVDRWVAFDQTKNGLEKWITQFGDETNNTNLRTKIDASGDAQSVTEQIDGVIKNILNQKMSQQTFLRSSIISTLIDQEEEEQAKARAL